MGLCMFNYVFYATKPAFFDTVMPTPGLNTFGIAITTSFYEMFYFAFVPSPVPAFFGVPENVCLRYS